MCSESSHSHSVCPFCAFGGSSRSVNASGAPLPVLLSVPNVADTIDQTQI